MLVRSSSLIALVWFVSASPPRARRVRELAERVLHGESSKRLATPRNTKKHKKHLQSTQLAQPTNLTDQGPSTTERTAWETHNTN